MGNRVVYGHSFSSNGWPMVDEGSCTWADIPGTDPTVRIQIQNGQPLAILRAFVADINAYVEHVRDADTACWTAGNSVDTSNHLSGTAVDIDWDSHPFHVPDAGWNPDQINTINEILDFYEGTVFWGNDWTDPKDAMHFQLASLANGGDINTFNNPHTQDFINRKIRADGFSTFRRGGTVTPPPAPGLSAKDQHALDIIREGQRRSITERGIVIALATGLVESNITIYANSKVPASMALPHEAVGSDGYSVGIFQQQVRDSGNGWWWGDAATCMDPTKSAGLFFDRLAKLNYNGPNSPGSYAQAVQQSAFPDRYDERMGDAQALYDRLASTAPSTGDDFMSALTDAEQRELLDLLRWIAAPGTGELRKQFPSRSAVREPNEGLVDTAVGMELNTDGNVDFLATFERAKLGFPPALERLKRVAAGGEPGRSADDALLAQAMLAEAQAPVNSTTPAVASQVVSPPDNTRELADAYAEIGRLREQLATVTTAPTAVPSVVYRDTPATIGSTGEAIGRLYTALESLKLADALPIEGRAPLAALISVLSTKNGSQV